MSDSQVMHPLIQGSSILGMSVAVTNREAASSLILDWSQEQVGRYVCVSNVHMCMEAYDSVPFQTVVNGADLAVPDGLPLVWVQRAMGHSSAQQVRGEDLMRNVCSLAELRQVPVGFFGASPELLARLHAAMKAIYPRLRIACMVAPPYRPMTDEENRQYARDIGDAGVRILFVGLGCPKQEKWMAEQKRNIPAVMLGVGAAFDFIAGDKKPAPTWVQRFGLEWLHRLVHEPRRLWKRYLKHNPRFLWHVSRRFLLPARPDNAA